MCRNNAGHENGATAEGAGDAVGVPKKHWFIAVVGHNTEKFSRDRLKELGYEVTYMGSLDGIEKKLIADFDIPYYGVPVGKLRRYIDPKNLTDPFKVIKGYSQAKKYLKEVKPDVVFSKGGYVSVPIVRAAASLKYFFTE